MCNCIVTIGKKNDGERLAKCALLGQGNKSISHSSSLNKMHLVPARIERSFAHIPNAVREQLFPHTWPKILEPLGPRVGYSEFLQNSPQILYVHRTFNNESRYLYIYIYIYIYIEFIRVYPYLIRVSNILYWIIKYKKFSNYTFVAII